MAIRYDQNLNKEIQRVVSNFNKKVARLEKQGRDLLPEKIYVADLKAEYDKRYELKRKLKELQRFSTRGIEEVIETEGGVRTTKYALDNAKRELRRAKYRESIFIKKEEKKSTPLTITRNGSINLAKDTLELLSKNINQLTPKEYETMMKNVSRILDYDHRGEIFQENFFQILFSEASYSGVKQSTLDNIKSTLSKLTPHQLAELWKVNPNIKAITDYSPTEGNTITKKRMREILEELEEDLPQIIEEYMVR